MLVAFWIPLILTCSAYVTGSPNLLIASVKDVRIANISRSPKSALLVKNLEEGAALDFYYEGSLVCWTEHASEMIQCVSYNGTTAGPKVGVVTTGLATPDGLAVDWLTQKLYWTDGEANRIEVATLTGQHRKVLIWDDIDQPRAIALVPMKGYMFWTDWGEVPKIERVAMNGDPKTRKVIVSKDIFWPNGLTIDYVSEKVYWLDGHLKFISSMDYDGRNRCVVARNGVDYPYALTMVDHRLYWTDWQQWAVYVLERTDCDAGGQARPRQLLKSENVPMGIVAWAEERQPRSDTPCGHGNGGCSHLCLLAPYPPWYSCACPTGVKLLDNRTCADGPRQLLLLAQRTDICRISLDTPDHTSFVMPLQGVRHAIAVDFDPVDEFLYWTDDEARALRRARLDGTGQEDLVTSEVEHPDGIAVDWIARNLYWTDTGTDRIEVARLSGASRKVLVNEDLVEPRGIALAPEHGWMFWSDWYEKRPKIERAAMDGSERRLLVSTGLGWPNGITLDLQRNKIYWCDAKTDKIEVAGMDGSDRREVIGDNVPHIFGISLMGEHLYWTDWQRRTIERVKLTGEDREEIVDQLPNVMGLKAVRLGAARGWNPCADSNGGCSHLCLNRPGNRSVCACQIGYELTSDSRTCVVPEAFLLFARRENIGRISIENGNNDVMIPVTGVRDASALDFDITDNRIYWTDVKVKAITRAFMNGSHLERIVEFGLETPEGLAVDWVAHNVYWTDMGSKRIEVARVNGRSRRVLLWSGLDDPRSLALDPREGFLYWSDWGDAGRLERAAMDGSRRTVLITKLGQANGLTIDYAQRRIYWTETSAPAIESADLDGNDRVQVVRDGIEKPYGLTQYQDFIYWTDWKTGYIECANKTNGCNRTRIHDKLEFITDILVFHNSRQSGWNQCAVGNGGCQHLCLALPASTGPGRQSYTHRCGCPTHYTLAPDNTTCSGRFRPPSPHTRDQLLCLALPASTGPGRQSYTHRCGCPTHYTLAPDNTTCSAPQSFLLCALKGHISRLVPDSADCLDVILPIPGLKNVRAVEFDPVSQFLYWIDRRTQAVRRALDDGTRAGVFIPGGSHHPYDLAIDPYAQLLYWTCALADTINVTRLANGSAVGVVARAGAGKPRSIALHPERGLMFWTDVSAKPRILRALMDGQKRSVIVQDLDSFAALAVDRNDDLLFWAHLNKIETSDLSGKHRRVLVVYERMEESSLAVLGDHVYWLDRDLQRIERADKRTGGARQALPARVSQLTALVAVQLPSAKTRSEHGCSAERRHGGCSHLCLAAPGANGTVCSCPAGLLLHEDRRSCSALPACGSDHFACASAPSALECVPLAWRCDGHADCPGGSDEADCPACRPDQLRCPGGPCIDKAWRCDGTPQCSDNYDETNCCQPGEYMCPGTELCIPQAELCDGWPHCSDGSDETHPDCAIGGENHRRAETHADALRPVYLACVLLGLVAALGLGAAACYCHRQGGEAPGDREDSAGDPLAPKPCPVLPVARGKPRPGPGAVRMSALHGSSTSGSYDRSHVTGASSSTAGYPRETLNPPPSPATTTDHDEYCCPSSGASRHRPYRRYRAINQPPPPTPCSTDVCDESDSCSYPRCRYYPPPGSEESDAFAPPPSPRSLSCPPSPSSGGRSSACLGPLPPPPSPC
ncbi:low-density lipoprotein receptor-related protein 6 isoform X2 [Bacillus rossius redtenbacheri]|uniref:low-density lipoprotein receptor-related protein 6 isoform X2 n=1 Tax=Bacillus rossius redtenbacheri TaxID=93214 RepID=UPI002FDC9914